MLSFTQIGGLEAQSHGPDSDNTEYQDQVYGATYQDPKRWLMDTP